MQIKDGKDSFRKEGNARRDFTRIASGSQSWEALNNDSIPEGNQGWEGFDKVS